MLPTRASLLQIMYVKLGNPRASVGREARRVQGEMLGNVQGTCNVFARPSAGITTAALDIVRSNDSRLDKL